MTDSDLGSDQSFSMLPYFNPFSRQALTCFAVSHQRLHGWETSGRPSRNVVFVALLSFWGTRLCLDIPSRPKLLLLLLLNSSWTSLPKVKDLPDKRWKRYRNTLQRNREIEQDRERYRERGRFFRTISRGPGHARGSDTTLWLNYFWHGQELLIFKRERDTYIYIYIWQHPRSNVAFLVKNATFIPSFTVNMVFQKSVWNETDFWKAIFWQFSKFLCSRWLPSPVSELWEALRSQISGMCSTNFQKCLKQGKCSICSIFLGHVPQKVLKTGEMFNMLNMFNPEGKYGRGLNMAPKNWTYWAFPLL